MSADVRRLLIVKTSSIGDVVHALPAASIVKRFRPDIEIGWVVRSRCADLVQGCPDIDRVYELSNKPGFGELAALGRQLRQDGYDMAWDMQGLSLSGVVTLLSGAPRRIGLDLNREGNRLFLNEPVVAARTNRRRHAIDILRGFLPSLAIPATVAWPPLCYLASDDKMAAEFVYNDTEGRDCMVALNIGASSVYKQWPVEQWALLSERLAATKRKTLMIGGPQDRGTADGVLRMLQNAASSDFVPIDLVGKTTLRQTASVLNRCMALVTADTGPMHIAAALRVPVVALFGPTEPVKTGPYATASETIKHECCTNNHRRPTCGGQVHCMESISVDEVIAALDAVLSMPNLERC